MIKIHPYVIRKTKNKLLLNKDILKIIIINLILGGTHQTNQ